MKPEFRPGRNIAMKVPAHEHDRAVAFYRDVLGLEPAGEEPFAGGTSVRFRFGDRVLWIDPVPGLSQAEIWLEVVTDDVTAAAAYLAGQDCARRDGIEPLPEGFEGFWLAGPGNIIHLVTGAGDD